jgi:hypothetical protein
MEKHEKLLNMLMDFNKDVRFAAVCATDGQILWHSQRDDVENVIPLAETKKTVKRAAKSWKSRNELQSQTGRGMYAIASYAKIKRITIPLDEDNLLFISLDNAPTKEGSYGKVADMGKIMSIVDFAVVN